MRQIFEIDAVATVSTALEEISFKWINRPDADKQALEYRARELVSCFRLGDNQQTPTQVFLLGERAKTEFTKDTSRGMQACKIYFRDVATGCQSAAELATRLKGKGWSQF